MVAIHLDELSCDSDSDRYYSDDNENQRRSYIGGVWFAPRKYVWEVGLSDDEDLCTVNSGGVEHTQQSLEQGLAVIEQEQDEWSTSRKAQLLALETFLTHDATAQRQANQEQEILLESLRQQHREEYLKDRAAAQIVEKKYEEEKRAEEDRRRLAEEEARRQRKEEERLADEARRKEEHNLQMLKEQEEKEKESYKLVQLSEPQSIQNRDALVALMNHYDEGLKAFCDDKSMKDARRGIKKFITLSVQQISATQEQVRKKSMGLIEFLSQQHGVHQKFALVTLASKMVSQCDAQVALIPSFAFPLAEVSGSIGRAYPDFTKLLIGMIQKECPLCVPVLFQPGPKASKNVEFYRAMMFLVDNGPTAKIESEEEYVNRLQGYVRLYAALLQIDGPSDLSNVAMGQAWSYLACLLNTIPACRYSASALDAFLSIAGFRLFTTFRNQFEKIMKYIEMNFLKDLADVRDPDASAVATRLASYINMRQYCQVPKGRDMPLRDASSQNRA